MTPFEFPLSFSSFSFPDKANLHQLQQPCNLMDKGSYRNSGFSPWWRKTCSGISHGRQKRMDVSLFGWISQERCTKMWHGDDRPHWWTKQGTRTNNSTIVRFHLLSASQEYTHTQKKKNTCMAEVWRLTDGAFLLSVYISAMPSFKDFFVILSSSDWNWTKIKNMFRCSQCRLPVLQTVINLKTLKASQRINQHQKGMKTRSMDSGNCVCFYF